jgi:phytoene/squalene synthetase
MRLFLSRKRSHALQALYGWCHAADAIADDAALDATQKQLQLAQNARRLARAT